MVQGGENEKTRGSDLLTNSLFTALAEMNRSLNGLAILQGTYSDSGSEHDETDDSNEIGSSPLSEDHVQHKVVDTNLTHVEVIFLVKYFPFGV